MHDMDNIFIRIQTLDPWTQTIEVEQRQQTIEYRQQNIEYRQYNKTQTIGLHHRINILVDYVYFF